MKLGKPGWNWCRLLLLAISSYLAIAGFGFAFPFMTSTPDDGLPVYPWHAGLLFSVLTAVIFLLCLGDPRQRRAACAAFGISALLTGPLYVWNAERLARFAPTSSPWIAPQLPFELSALCWILSAGLFVWWLRRSASTTSQGTGPALLFSGLLLVLLVIPWATNLCGIESMRIIIALPANADAFRQNTDTLTHFLIKWEATSVGDVCGFLIQTIGLAISALIFVYVGMVTRAAWPKRTSIAAAAHAFPSHIDLLPLLLFFLGGLVFTVETSLFAGLFSEFSDLEHTMERPIYPYHAGLITIQVLTGLVFFTGSWLLLRRIQTASHLRFMFTLFVLMAAAALSVSAILVAQHAMRAVGFAALFLCVLKIIAFFQHKGRMRWTSSIFASPSETARSFAIQGSLLLAVMASALMAVAIELAIISVFAIKYFIMWGTALKPLHGVAPIDKIAPDVAPSLASVTILLGPMYLAVCLFVGVSTVLLFSLVYSGGQGCAKLYRRIREFKRSRTTPVPEVIIERHPSVRAETSFL